MNGTTIMDPTKSKKAMGFCEGDRVRCTGYNGEAVVMKVHRYPAVGHRGFMYSVYVNFPDEGEGVFRVFAPGLLSLVD